MLEEILEEIGKMNYPSQGIGCGLEDEGITDRYEAAAYGFREAQERIEAIIRRHMEDDGWIPCGDRLPEEPIPNVYRGLVEMDSYPEYIVMIDDAEEPTVLKYTGDGEWYSDGIFYSVIAWQPFPAPYRPKQKAVGEDYKQRIMGRFLKLE